MRSRFDDAVEAVGLDFTDPATWPDAYTGLERMSLMRPPHLGKPKTHMLPSLGATKAAGVHQMVLLSLQGAEHNKVVPHHALEKWLRELGVDWTFVRASIFMQNLTTTYLADIRDRSAIIVPAGNGETAFVDACDVAAVAVAALLDPDTHRNTAWTPTGPRALTYQQIATILTAALERPITYTRPGAITYALHARRSMGMPWAMVTVTVTTAAYTITRLGRAAGVTTDVRTVTGVDPISFEDFATREKAAWG